jgi:hypothetical protein
MAAVNVFVFPGPMPKTPGLAPSNATLIVPLFVKVPVQRMTAPLGTVSVCPVATVKFWNMGLRGGADVQSSAAETVWSPAEPSP